MAAQSSQDLKNKFIGTWKLVSAEAQQPNGEVVPYRYGVGSIGYISNTGAMDMSIVIRTYIALRGRVYFQAGGGIVADSDPEQEYRETLDKARALIDVLALEKGEK